MTVRMPARTTLQVLDENRPWHERWRVGLVAMLFLVIVVIELASPIFRGQWYTPADFGQAFSVTAVAGKPVQNPLQIDPYSQINPDFRLDVQSVRSGHLPTWNPDNANGAPFLASDFPATFSPFTVPFYVLPFSVALVVSAGLKLWCLAFFTFLWLRRLLKNDLAAVLGGVLFAFAGYQVIWLDWQVQVATAAAIPFGLWVAEVGLDWCAREPDSPDEVRTRRRSLRLCIAGGAAALAIAAFGGHPETALFAGLIWGLYCLVGGIARLGLSARFVRWVLSFVGVLVLGLGISAVELLPLAQYEHISSRAAFLQATHLPNLAAFHKTTLPMLAFPNLFGTVSSHYYDKAFFAEYGTSYPESNDAFVGLVALALAPLAIAGLFVRRIRWASAVGLGLSVLGVLFLYTGLASRILHAIPVIGGASLNRSQDVLILGIVTSAAAGVAWLLAGTEEGWLRDWRWRIGIAAGTAAAVTVLAAGGARWLRRHVESGVGGAATAAGSPYVRSQIAIQVICVFAALVLLVVLVRWRHRSVPVTASLGVVAAACVSVMLPLHGWNPSVPAARAYPVTRDVSLLRKAVGTDLTLYLNNVFASPNTNLWFGLNDLGSYDRFGVRWRDDLYGKAFGIPQSTLGGNDIRTEQLPACSEALRLFGVQRVVGPQVTSAVFKRGGRLTAKRQGTTAPFYTFDVPDSGLVSLVGRSAAVPGDATGLAEVTECGFQPNREVVIDPDAYRPTLSSAIPVFKGPVLHGTARVVSRTATTVTVDTKAAQGGWLVVRQSWFPGWEATVDGHAATVRRADVAFQAVAVPAGSHTVTLRYAPRSVSTGVKVSVAAALLTILVAVWAAADWPPYGWVQVGQIRERWRVRRTRRAYRER